MSYRLRVRNAAQLVTVCSGGQRFKAGKDQDEVPIHLKKLESALVLSGCGTMREQVEIIENGSIIVGQDGNIVAVGREEELSKTYATATFDVDIDATGKVVLPGMLHSS